MFELLFEPSRSVQIAIEVIARGTGLIHNGSCRIGFDGNQFPYGFTSVFSFGSPSFPFCKPWVSLHIRGGDSNFKDNLSAREVPLASEFFSCGKSFQQQYGSNMSVMLVESRNQNNSVMHFSSLLNATCNMF